MERQAARPSAADLHSSEMTVGGRCRPHRLGAGATSVDLDVYSATHVQLARCCHVVPSAPSSPRAGGSALAGNSDFYGGATPRDDGPRFMRSQGRLRETRLKPQEVPPVPAEPHDAGLRPSRVPAHPADSGLETTN